MHQYKRSEFNTQGGCAVCGQPWDTAQHRANGLGEFKPGGLFINVGPDFGLLVAEWLKDRSES